MALTKKQELIFSYTIAVRDQIFGGKFGDNTTYLDVAKLFPRVVPGFEPNDLGYTSYEALANDLAELTEALEDEDGEGDILDCVVNEFKQNPIKTGVKALSILGAIFGIGGFFS